MGMSWEEMADRITDYVRIRKAEKRNPEQIHRTLQQGYRTEHPERIMGYAGFFFDLGDVYVSGGVARWMKVNEEFRSFVEESLQRFDKGDWGLISQSDEDENVENRYLFGIGRLFGRYGFYLPDCGRREGDRFDDFICIRKLDENTWVSYDSEADWFLFLEEDQVPLIRDIDWQDYDDDYE